MGIRLKLVKQTDVVENGNENIDIQYAESNKILFKNLLQAPAQTTI